MSWQQWHDVPEDVNYDPFAVPADPAAAPASRTTAEADAVRPSHARHISEFRERIIAEARLRAQYGDDAIGGEALGFVELDEHFAVDAGKLIVIAAREGVGKTAWGLQVARTIATRTSAMTGRGGTVAYYITEMGVQETVERVIVSFAQVNARSIKRGVTEDVVAAMERAFDLLENSGLHIIDASGWTVDQVIADARSFRREHDDLRAVFVDNLTGISPSATRRTAGSHEYIGEIVEKLNMLAMRAKGIAAPLFLLCHLARPDKMARSKRPTSMDLAGSDKINRWANTIILLHERSEEERKSAPTPGPVAPASVGGFGGAGLSVLKVDPFGELASYGGEKWHQSEIGSADRTCSHELLVTKNRSGRRFICDLDFIGPQMRFIDPKGKTVRPFDLPEAESALRTQFRSAMGSLEAI